MKYAKIAISLVLFFLCFMGTVWGEDDVCRKHMIKPEEFESWEKLKELKHINIKLIKYCKSGDNEKQSVLAFYVISKTEKPYLYSWEYSVNGVRCKANRYKILFKYFYFEPEEPKPINPQKEVSRKTI